MATLTVTHHDDQAVVDDLDKIGDANGATEISASAGTTVMEFPSEAEARMVASVLAHAATVTGLKVTP